MSLFSTYNISKYFNKSNGNGAIRFVRGCYVRGYGEYLRGHTRMRAHPPNTHTCAHTHTHMHMHAHYALPS